MEFRCIICGRKVPDDVIKYMKKDLNMSDDEMKNGYFMCSKCFNKILYIIERMEEDKEKDKEKEKDKDKGGVGG